MYARQFGRWLMCSCAGSKRFSRGSVKKCDSAKAREKKVERDIKLPCNKDSVYALVDITAVAHLQAKI